MKKLKVMAVVLALTLATNVHAAVQVKPGVAPKLIQGSWLSANDLFASIRQMEGENGALGLNATFGTGYAETSAPNNVDAHMCKNTEWGAIVMLTASNYGAGTVSNDYNSSTYTYGLNASTTGNMTGVFGMAHGAAMDCVAGGINFYKSAPIRYVDRYEAGTDSDDYSRYIPGDATYETITFASSWDYDFVVTNSPIFVRGHGNMFKFKNMSINGMNYNGLSSGSRACLWVGDGI